MLNTVSDYSILTRILGIFNTVIDCEQTIGTGIDIGIYINDISR